MRFLAALALLTLATASWADQSPKKHLRNAEDALDDARDLAKRGGRTCREAIASQLRDLGDRVSASRKTDQAREVWQLKNDAQQLGVAASMAGCPLTVSDKIHDAVESLEEARAMLRRERRDDDDDDRRDPYDGQQGGYARPPAQPVALATLSPLQVQPNAVFERAPAVKLSVPELRLEHLQGQSFYLATRYRSYEGQWSEWVTTQTWSVPQDPFVWKNAFSHFLRYSALAEDDFSDGRFVAVVTVFDQNGQELASREATFKVKLPRLPEAPPVQPVAALPAARDCGTGNDPGCTMTRDGQWAVDGVTFQGVLTSMRANPNEMFKMDSARTFFSRNYVTALQLAGVLDLFLNEAFRLDVAKMASPHVVNPGHAIGYASRFRNPIFARDYMAVMTGQPATHGAEPVGGAMPAGYAQPSAMPPGYSQPTAVPAGYAQPTQPILPPPPPGLPPGYGRPPGVPPPPVAVAQPVRDCGTGSDPGCAVQRNGAFAMDAATFQGFMTALRATQNELSREQTVGTMFQRNACTALQLSQILDLFSNELTRLNVGKQAAPHVVDPSHALGFAAKFRNGLLGQEYTQVMAAQ